MTGQKKQKKKSLEKVKTFEEFRQEWTNEFGEPENNNEKGFIKSKIGLKKEFYQKYVKEFRINQTSVKKWLKKNLDSAMWYLYHLQNPKDLEKQWKKPFKTKDKGDFYISIPK